MLRLRPNLSAVATRRSGPIAVVGMCSKGRAQRLGFTRSPYRVPDQTARIFASTYETLFQLDFNELERSISNVLYATLFGSDSHEIVIL